MKATRFHAVKAGALQKPRRPILAWVPVLWCLLCVAPAVGQTHDSEIQPKPADNFTVARFRLYLPPGVEQVRGVAILVPGHNEDGRPLTGKDGWPQFAAKNRVALLACQFEDDESRDYSNADRGSGMAVVQVLRDLERQTGHRGLGQANFMVYGYSSGAQFAASMTLVKPERMFGFAALIGASWARSDTSSRKVPGLFVSTPDQKDDAAEKTTQYVAKNRALGANWAQFRAESILVAMQSLLPLVQNHLEASMAIRQRGEALPGGKLENLSPVDGWVVRFAEGKEEILQAADLPRSGLNSSFWFPARETAEMWLSMKAGLGAK